MSKKKYLCVAVALALSSTYAQAVTIDNKVIQTGDYEEESLDVTPSGRLEASNIKIQNKLTVNQGEVVATGNLTASSIETQKTSSGGKILVENGIITITGEQNTIGLKNWYGGTIKAKELHFENANMIIESRGNITLDKLVGKSIAIDNARDALTTNSEFTIREMPAQLASLKNYETFKVGSGGQTLTVLGDVENGQDGILTAVDGSSIGLDVGGSFITYNTLTLTKLDVGALLTASADLTVTGDVTARVYLRFVGKF